MVIDAAKGIEARTRKLFEVCRLRDIPIITFINKLDREAREPLELLDEIEKVLALDTAPMVWPIGKGRGFRGTYDLLHPRIRRIDEAPEGMPVYGAGRSGIRDAAWSPTIWQRWREEIELVHDACGRFDLKAFREGTLSPVYFGSALRNFGVRDLLDALISYAPPPLSRKAATRTIEATEPAMTGIIFKIQANMDPNHRDRMAFMRLCSGRLTRGMKVKHVRTGKIMALTAPQFFFAQDRSLAEEAFAGDVVGIPNRGTLRIGDALTEGEDVQFLGIPSFAPEILRRIRLEDAIRAKKLKDALKEMAEEGVVQLFSPTRRHAAHRRRHRRAAARRARRPADARVRSADRLRAGAVRGGALDQLGRSGQADALCREEHGSSIAKDFEGDYVYLATSVFSLSYKEEHNPEIAFTDIKAITHK